MLNAYVENILGSEMEQIVFCFFVHLLILYFSNKYVKMLDITEKIY